MESKRTANLTVASMLDGLIGQANLEHARGNTNEAITLLNEAIRQAPRNINAYIQISNVYADLNQMDKSFEYRLLAAHMATRTPAEEWAEIGDMALALERLEEASSCYDKGTIKFFFVIYIF